MPPLSTTTAEVDEAIDLAAGQSRRSAGASTLMTRARLGAGRGAGLARRDRCRGADVARAGAQAGRLLPHNYYWRELYLPQLTTGPSSASFMPDGRRARLQHGGLALAAGDRLAGGDRAHARAAVPTTTSPTSRPTGDASCSRATTATRWSCGELDLAQRSRARADARTARSTSSRASRPTARRLAWVSTQRDGPLRRPRRRSRCRPGSTQRGAAAAAAPQHDRSLLLLGDRSRDQPGVVAGRQVALLRRQSGGRLGHGRHLVGRAREPCRAAQGAERGDDLERASGTVARRAADPVFELSRPAMAPALAHDAGGRRAAAAHVRRVRPPQRALVARRQADRVHQQRARRHRARRAARRRRRHDRRAADRAPVPHAARAARRSMPATRRAARCRFAISVVAQRRARVRARRRPGCTPTTASIASLQRTETHYFHCAPTVLGVGAGGRCAGDRAARIPLSRRCSRPYASTPDGPAKLGVQRCASTSCPPSSARGSAPICTCT